MPIERVLPLIKVADARRLFLHGQGLCGRNGEAPPATPRGVARLIERIGFVQVDTISTVERAHHLILSARIDGYRPPMLSHAMERDRLLFEHWTHDASIIPLKWYGHWHHRFDRYRESSWHRKHLGRDADRIVAHVLDRITAEGPLASRDFENLGDKKTGSWWGWKPHKVALDYLWRIGVLHVHSRRNFDKVYELSERVVADHATIEKPSDAEHVDWACRTALERLGTATPREIAQFWAAVKVDRVTAWLKSAVAADEVTAVAVESADGSPPIRAYAFADVRKRIAKAPEPPHGARLLCPFDPIVRDRARAKRLFSFDFRFEGFVPAAQRKHGYYVMPILAGDRFIGRADPKFDRGSGRLTVRKIWREPDVDGSRKHAKAIERGIETLAGWISAKSIELPAVRDADHSRFA
jgi:uncharacterized protein YcaQ